MLLLSFRGRGGEKKGVNYCHGNWEEKGERGEKHLLCFLWIFFVILKWGGVREEKGGGGGGRERYLFIDYHKEFQEEGKRVFIGSVTSYPTGQRPSTKRKGPGEKKGGKPRSRSPPLTARQEGKKKTKLF